jgi:cystathionine beta-lyase
MEFNKIIERRGSACFKYDALKTVYGREDLIPLWVADMDFAVSDEILKALKTRLEHPIFGYNFPNEQFHQSIKNWMDKRFGWDPSALKTISVPSLMTALAIAILSLSKTGDKILIQTPVYPPFHSTVVEHSRELLTNPLIRVENRYEVDWHDFEAKCSRAKMFILCNPHNPVGKVFSREELQRMHDICSKHKVLIFSDEIHADIVYPPFQHIPIASLGPENVITGISPAKSFNLAGLATAVMFAPRGEISRALAAMNETLHTFMGNSFGIVAFTAAYTKAGYWLDELLTYLQSNRDVLRNFFANELREIKMLDCEGTFLAWLDCRQLGMNEAELKDFITNKAGLALNPGHTFGQEGQGYMRLNFAVPRPILTEALDRLRTALRDKL